MPDNESPLSRRQIVGGAGLGLAALAAAPAEAQSAVPAVTPKPLQDPTTKYPRPPYPRQSQPWPGLAGKMDPKPDHGEASYEGSGRLAGRKALITGGDSGMGRAPPSPMPAKARTSRSTTFPTRSPMPARWSS